MGITDKQSKFAKNISEGLTYYDAYHDAYPASKKWKDNAVYVQSSMLMKNSKVMIRIQELVEENKKRNQATLDEVLNEMASWLRFDPLELFDENNCVKEMKDIPVNIRKCLDGPIEVVELFAGSGENRISIGELKKVKLQSKTRISDQFLKKFGAYITNVHVKTDDISHLQDLIDGIKE